MKRAAMMTAAALLTAGCGGQPFAERDPKGYEACSEHASYSSKGGVTNRVGGNLVVAEIARSSSTKEIRDSVTNIFEEEALESAGGEQVGLLDVEKFERACSDQGFEFAD